MAQVVAPRVADEIRPQTINPTDRWVRCQRRRAGDHVHSSAPATSQKGKAGRKMRTSGASQRRPPKVDRFRRRVRGSCPSQEAIGDISPTLSSFIPRRTWCGDAHDIRRECLIPRLSLRLLKVSVPFFSDSTGATTPAMSDAVQSPGRGMQPKSTGSCVREMGGYRARMDVDN